jgi:hypothetical protein
MKAETCTKKPLHCLPRSFQNQRTAERTRLALGFCLRRVSALHRESGAESNSNLSYRNLSLKSKGVPGGLPDSNGSRNLAALVLVVLLYQPKRPTNHKHTVPSSSKRLVHKKEREQKREKFLRANLILPSEAFTDRRRSESSSGATSPTDYSAFKL